MTTELKDSLCTYLGELKNDHEQEHVWNIKEKLARKIEAVNLLLGFEVEIKTWHQMLNEN